MGKKGFALEQARQNTSQKKQLRDRRAAKVKASRRNDTFEEDRRLKRMVVQRREPTSEQKTLLLHQCAMAVRIPKAADDFIAMMERLVGDNENNAEGQQRRRSRADDAQEDAGSTLQAIADNLLQHLADIVPDELGSRCLVSFLNCLAKFHAGEGSAATVVPKPSDVVELLLNLSSSSTTTNGNEGNKNEGDEEDEIGVELDPEDEGYNEQLYKPKLDLVSLTQHHNARKIVWAMIEHGSKKQQKQIAEGLTSIAQELAFHRHGSIALLRLLQQSEKSARILSATLVPLIPQLIADAVGFNIATALITDSNRLQVFESLATDNNVIANLLEDKRGMRFIVTLLKVEATPSPEAAEGMCTIAERIVGALKERLVDLSTDPRGNFLVQGVFKAAAQAKRVQLQKKMLELLQPSLLKFCRHSIGIHVVLCLINNGDEKAVRKPIVNHLRGSLVDLVAQEHGSLVVRALIALEATSLYPLLETHLEKLMMDISGNLVVQQLLKHVSPQQRLTFINKCVKPNVLSLCQHKYASHVIGSILEIADSTTHTDLCAALRPHALHLAQHVSGRFVVEKMMNLHKEVRELLLTNFMNLMGTQGTQHLLKQVYLSTDQKARRTLVNTVILPSVAELACSKTSSIVLQKLLQGEMEVEAEKRVLLPALVSAFNSKPGLRQRLAQDFHGRFVAEGVKNYQ